MVVFYIYTILRNRTATAFFVRNQREEMRDVIDVNRPSFVSLTYHCTFAHSHVQWNRYDQGWVLSSDESLLTSLGQMHDDDCGEDLGRDICCRLFGWASYIWWCVGLGKNNCRNIDRLRFYRKWFLTSYRYANNILQDHVMPFMLIMEEHGIDMQDNARPHTTGIFRISVWGRN